MDYLIQHYFEPSDEVVGKLKFRYGKYLDTNTCAIHIRRGDFVNNQTHNVCDVNYYNTAIGNISSKEKIDNFLIFSDDINWCKENFKWEPLAIFIEADELESLKMMTLCHHHIICNSTFSWWGAYLCEHDNTVVMPKNWWGPALTNPRPLEHYLMPDWILI